MPRLIALQYNPDTLSRTLQRQSVSIEGGELWEAKRSKGAPAETMELED